MPGHVYAGANGWNEGAAGNTNSVAMGGGQVDSMSTPASVRGQNSVAVGAGASVDVSSSQNDFNSANATAIGTKSSVSAMQGTAVGYSSKVTGAQGTGGNRVLPKLKMLLHSAKVVTLKLLSQRPSVQGQMLATEPINLLPSVLIVPYIVLI